MIGYLKGNILEKSPQNVLVLVQDMGYEVYISEKTYYQLGEINDEVSFLIYTNVREDAIELYGFLEDLDKKVFLHLISVSGIGAKSAIQILGKVDAGNLIQSILSGDVNYLTKLPGVGKKTANRIVVELADKFKKEYSFTDVEIKVQKEPLSQVYTDVLGDVIEGLKGLGYGEKEIMPTIERLDTKDKSAEALFKEALSWLAKGK